MLISCNRRLHTKSSPSVIPSPTIKLIAFPLRLHTAAEALLLVVGPATVVVVKIADADVRDADLVRSALVDA